MSEEDARRSLGKLSDTPFSLRALTVQTAGAFVPVSVLNQLRRRGLSAAGGSKNCGIHAQSWARRTCG